MYDIDDININIKYQYEEPLTLSQVIEEIDKLDNRDGFRQECEYLWVLHGQLLANSIRGFQ